MQDQYPLEKLIQSSFNTKEIPKATRRHPGTVTRCLGVNINAQRCQC